ncbi:MAG: hypothetical protein ABR599_10445 [Gemmatimonadota bacterium]
MPSTGEGWAPDARVLVGGIGYRNLRDHSVGIAVVERLAVRECLEAIAVEDVSYNPIALVQRLEDEAPDRRFGRAVVVGGVSRGGRTPGSVTAYRWDGALPAPEDVQRAVAEAVTGIISLDNTLVIVRHFGALPEDVAVIEVEPDGGACGPDGEAFGDALSPAVAGAFDAVCELVGRLATDPARAARLPRAALGGSRVPALADT